MREEFLYDPGGEGSPPGATFLDLLSVSICIKFQPQPKPRIRLFFRCPLCGQKFKTGNGYRRHFLRCYISRGGTVEIPFVNIIVSSTSCSDYIFFSCDEFYSDYRVQQLD